MTSISLPVQHISDTAFLTAFYRALESDRPDALFHDPYARLLAGVRGEQVFRQMPYPEKLAPGTIVRTCILDELILKWIGQHGVETVLNLGAGLDTRAYRLPLPKSLRWVEADMPDVIEYKTHTLAEHQPRCSLQSTALDVTDAAARQNLLQRIGTQANQILVVTEGLLVYMELAQVVTLAQNLWAQSQVAWWLTDLVSPLWLQAMAQVLPASEQTTHHAQFQFAPENGNTFFRELGWDTVEFRSVLEDGQQLQRLELPEPLLALWSSPEHREVLRQMCCVALMQRSDCMT